MTESSNSYIQVFIGHDNYKYFASPEWVEEQFDVIHVACAGKVHSNLQTPPYVAKFIDGTEVNRIGLKLCQALDVNEHLKDAIKPLDEKNDEILNG